MQIAVGCRTPARRPGKPGHQDLKNISRLFSQRFRAVLSRFVIGGRRPACYPEIGVEAYAQPRES